MKIMKVRLPDGSVVSIPLGKGADGKSAYQYAKEGGYIGTESEFAQLLGDINSGASSPVLSVNGKTGAVTLSASDVGADASGTASSAVSAHNISTTAHNDMRIELKALADRINAVLDSDDTTLDELSEIVAYIKSNKALIEQVTSTKVNVSDIVNNLTSNVSNKPLSAAQGVALKGLIEAITVPTKVSQLTNDAKYLTSVPSEYVTETELSGKGETWTFKLKDGSTVTKKVVIL